MAEAEKNKKAPDRVRSLNQAENSRALMFFFGA